MPIVISYSLRQKIVKWWIPWLVRLTWSTHPLGEQSTIALEIFSAENILLYLFCACIISDGILSNNPSTSTLTYSQLSIVSFEELGDCSVCNKGDCGTEHNLHPYYPPRFLYSLYTWYKEVRPIGLLFRIKKTSNCTLWWHLWCWCIRQKTSLFTGKLT